jgi:putative DNA primase/helicase
MIDVPVVAKYGVFDCLHNGWGAKEFAEYLKNAAADDYGFAGPLFVEHLIKSRSSLDLKGRLALLSAQVANGATMTAQEGRVLRSFALVALAGELATEAGILPWKAGSALNAAKRLFETWRKAQPQSATSREHAQILEKTSNFIARHCDTRYTDLKPRTHWDYTDQKNPKLVKDAEQPKAYQRAGYYEDIGERRIYLFTRDGLREATQGFDFGRVLQALDEGGAFYVIGSGGEKAKLRRLPGGG